MEWLFNVLIMKRGGQEFKNKVIVTGTQQSAKTHEICKGLYFLSALFVLELTCFEKTLPTISVDGTAELKYEEHMMGNSNRILIVQ